MLYQNKVSLTKKDILEKEFKVDTRGFRPQEVDKFLDIIIQDYDAFNGTIKDMDEELKAMFEENLKLKKEIRALNLKLETLKEPSFSSHEVNNSDLLRRLSNLEKVIYGKE